MLNESTEETVLGGARRSARIQVPQNEEEAVAMELYGHAWLTQHAPHRLTANNLENIRLAQNKALDEAATLVLDPRYVSRNAIHTMILGLKKEPPK